VAERRHLAVLDRGVKAWNAWRRAHPNLSPDLSRALLIDRELRGINLAGANLERTNLRGTTLSRANLSRANLKRADLRASSLRRARLDHAELAGAILRHASLAETHIGGASFAGCEVYGLAAWNLQGTPRDQTNLMIRATPREPPIMVDELELAQFVYLLVHNEKLKNFVETVGRKGVLILGRFTPQRKAVLAAVKGALRTRGYVPLLFDFDRPRNRTLTETVTTLARMSRFIVADLTDAKSVPHELMAIVPALPRVPVVPILLASRRPYAMFADLRDYPWVFAPLTYRDTDDLVAKLKASFIERAEKRARRLTGF
jgi:uncharacterized protein YjbI with pentapeptide repeats